MSSPKEKLRCIEDVNKLFEHQLNVIRGNIVQLHYFVPSELCVRARQQFVFMQDEFLCRFAKQFSGVESFNQGIVNNIRNIDILFSDYVKAEEFKDVLKRCYPVYCIYKEIMHIGNDLLNVKTVEDMMHRKSKTIQAFCGNLLVKDNGSSGMTVVKMQ